MVYVLNPPKHRRKKKSHRRRGRKRNSWRGASRRHARAARKGWRRKHRKSNPVRHRRRAKSHRARRRGRRRNHFTLPTLNPKRRRRSRKGSSVRHRRRRNPGGGGSVGGLISTVPSVLPAIHIPVKGMIGKIVNGMVQGAAAGGIVLGGAVISGYIVAPIDNALRKSDGTERLGKFQRPILFGAVAGLTGTIMSFGAKLVKGNRALWFMLGAAGPGLRAAASFLKIVIPESSTGVMANIKNYAAGLSDYLQIEGTEDYLQTQGTDGANVDEAVGAEVTEAVGDSDYDSGGV